MKTISQTLMICLLVLSTTVIQASHPYSRTNRYQRVTPTGFPPLTRNAHVAIPNSSLLRTQQVTSPIPSSTTPETVRLSTPSPASVQQFAPTQEYVSNLIALNQQLATENAEYKTQLTTLTEENKSIKKLNITLLYATKTQLDQLNHCKNRLARIEVKTNEQDVVITEQSNQISVLQNQITGLTMNTSTATQNNNAK